MKIYVKDVETNIVHRVGTDEHDSLYVDPETGGIHFENLQGVIGTKSGEYVFCDFRGKELTHLDPLTEDVQYLGIGSSLLK